MRKIAENCGKVAEKLRWRLQLSAILRKQHFWTVADPPPPILLATTLVGILGRAKFEEHPKKKCETGKEAIGHEMAQTMK